MGSGIAKATCFEDSSFGLTEATDDPAAPLPLGPEGTGSPHPTLPMCYSPESPVCGDLDAIRRERFYIEFAPKQNALRPKLALKIRRNTSDSNLPSAPSLPVSDPQLEQVPVSGATPSPRTTPDMISSLILPLQQHVEQCSPTTGSLPFLSLSPLIIPLADDSPRTLSLRSPELASAIESPRLLSPSQTVRPDPLLLLSPSQIRAPVGQQNRLASDGLPDAKIVNAIMYYINKGNLGQLQRFTLMYSVYLPSVAFPASFSPIHVAVQTGNIDMLVFLANQNLPVECKDKNGVTPLELASNKGDLRIMDYLMTYDGGYTSNAPSTCSSSWSPTVDHGGPRGMQHHRRLSIAVDPASEHMGDESSPVHETLDPQSPMCFSTVGIAGNVSGPSSPSSGCQQASPVSTATQDLLLKTVEWTTASSENGATKLNFDDHHSPYYILADEKNYEEGGVDEDDAASISSNVDVESELGRHTSSSRFTVFGRGSSTGKFAEPSKTRILPRSIRKAASRAMSLIAPRYFPRARAQQLALNIPSTMTVSLSAGANTPLQIV